MAVQNYFTNYAPAEGTNVKEEWGIRGYAGVVERYFQNSFTKAAADSDTSTYTLVKNLPADAIIAALSLEIDAAAGFTSLSIGLYDSDTGAAIAANCYMNAVNVAAGSTKLSPFDGMPALTHENTMQQAFLLAGHTLLNKKGSYDLVATVNTSGGNVSVVTARGRLIPAG